MIPVTAGQTCLGVDLGASSGRVMAGWYDGSKILLEEIHRFENTPVQQGDTLCWNFDGLMDEITTGLQRGITTAREAGRPVHSIGIDSWAVDFGLIDEFGNLVGPVVNYRDARTEGQMKKVFAKVSRETIFNITGIQFLPFNTIYQLAALKKKDPDQLDRARCFMMIADLVAWKLTGVVTCEYTNATTTQLLDVQQGRWSAELLEELDLPAGIFPPVTHAGTTIGKLRPNLADAWDAPDVRVIAVATHDTASAVLGVPAPVGPIAYLSCGTWSLLGTELSAPVISPETMAANFTNEGGAFNTFRFLRNIMGLWILQECRREWHRQGKPYTWPELEQLAIEAPQNSGTIDVDDDRLLPPGNMPERVQQLCRDAGLVVPETDGAIVAVILRSLAQRYRDVFETMERLSGVTFTGLYVVGGGVQNRLLLQLTQEALQRPVWAGPAEATVLGNIGMQMIANGTIADIAELRTILSQQ